MENQKDTNSSATNHKKSTFREFISLGEVGGYFFRKKDPNRPTNINLKMMHGINKISIGIFLVAVIYLIVKRFF
ncbi:MAG: hypothetical protein JNM57_03850 [Cyclobacteriaceae bacterium]|nr:hypothetical protein [Cyclobacteriaceae bacterium]